MPDFLKLVSPENAHIQYLPLIKPIERIERISVFEANGRVSAENILSEVALPNFRKSTVDGYAVRAKDVAGASASLPAYLHCVGEIHMGEEATLQLNAEECVIIHTGGMLPDSADAVVMVEYSAKMADEIVELQRSVAVGENVIQVGEDIHAGEVILPANKRIKSVDMGALLAMGVTEIDVFEKPQVAILTSGDEVMPPETKTLQPGQVRNINSIMMARVVEEFGCEAKLYPILPDNDEIFEENVKEAIENFDIVLISAGSSASDKDMTARVINRLGEPGVVLHGLNIRPGKPTIFAMVDGKPVLGLPGNPVSAWVIHQVMVVPILERLCGQETFHLWGRMPALLEINIPSISGRQDWVPAKLILQENGSYLARPIFGKSNLIFTLSRADGLICVPATATGLAAGEKVEVYLIR
jgi:molybdopterin molybdotransferase